MPVVKSAIRVATPPAKPLMIYDGDCRFCTLWIHRWQCATGDLIDYLPSQDPQVAQRFPEIPRAEFDASVQLVETDGSIYSGAEAVFRSLAHKETFQWVRNFYEDFPLFKQVTEKSYNFVARHRTFFSYATRLLWGKHVERPSYFFVRRAFVGCLGVIYLIAFVSLWVQVAGLFGSGGIVPVRDKMAAWKQEATDANIGFSRYFRLPTVCWLSSSDGFLNLQCAAGTALALVVIFGIAPAPCLFLLWLIYLSLCTVGEPFLSFQWDILLLETGFLAIFFAPWHLLPRHPLREHPPSRVALWLLRLLLFKLMFQSGVVKLASHDPTWRDGTALNYHFQTQPLPTWIGWYAHQLPAWVHFTDVKMMFLIELVIPVLIFFPRRPRQFACLALLALQLFILLTGNYCFFNLLTMVLCITLLDDAALQKCLPRKWCTLSPANESEAADTWQRHLFRVLRTVLTVPLVLVVLITYYVQFFSMFGWPLWLPRPLPAIYLRAEPFRSFNSYGLFAVMTTSRPEIIIEGSNDGENWQAYEFRYKPGDLRRRPGFVAPHQPRLDWQMWFAALSDYQHNLWFVNLCERLLEGSPQTLALMGTNPFPKAPPKYIRALVYEYRFTNMANRRKHGDWWQRRPERIYLPMVSLPSNPGGPSGRPAR
jgi:predicted DCC family thiol-disulfide oxidoreductase YuxK